MHFVFPFLSDDYIICMVYLIIGKIIQSTMLLMQLVQAKEYFFSSSGRQSYKIKLHYTQHLN